MMLIMLAMRNQRYREVRMSRSGFPVHWLYSGILHGQEKGACITR